MSVSSLTATAGVRVPHEYALAALIGDSGDSVFLSWFDDCPVVFGGEFLVDVEMFSKDISLARVATREGPGVRTNGEGPAGLQARCVWVEGGGVKVRF